jgi:hypothetical protein
MESVHYAFNTLEEYLLNGGGDSKFSTMGGYTYRSQLTHVFVKQIVPDYAEQFANGTIVLTEAQSLEMGGRLMGLLRPRLAQIKAWDEIPLNTKQRHKLRTITIFDKKYLLNINRDEHEEIMDLWLLVKFFYDALHEHKTACIWNGEHFMWYGSVFNKYIKKNLFAFAKYKIDERVSAIPLRPSTSAEPDFRAKFDAGEELCYIATRFLPMGEQLTWGIAADLDVFKAYEAGTPFYLLLGVGADETAPEVLYLIPLEKVMSITLERASLAPYALPLGQLVHREQLWGKE